LIYYKETNPANPKLEDLSDKIKAAYCLDTATLTSYESSLLSNAFAKFISTDTKPSNDQESVLYGTYNPLSVTLSHIINYKAGLSFSSYSHTGVPVPVYAVGIGSEMCCKEIVKLIWSAFLYPQGTLRRLDSPAKKNTTRWCANTILLTLYVMVSMKMDMFPRGLSEGHILGHAYLL